MHQKTVDLGHYFNGLGKDFMVRGMEAIKCQQVDIIISDCRECQETVVLQRKTTADESTLLMFTLVLC